VSPWRVHLYTHPFPCASRLEREASDYKLLNQSTLGQSKHKTISGLIASYPGGGQALGEETQGAGHGYNTMLGKTCINKCQKINTHEHSGPLAIWTDFFQVTLSRGWVS